MNEAHCTGGDSGYKFCEHERGHHHGWVTARCITYSNKTRSAVMERQLKVMVPVCCIYDIDFWNPVEYHELDIGEDINKQKYFVLLTSIYNVQRNRNPDHSGYDALTFKDLRDVTRVLKGIKTMEVHIRASCSSHRFVFWYKALVFHPRAERACITSDREDLASKSKEGKTVEHLLSFAVELLALHYDHAFGNY